MEAIVLQNNNFVFIENRFHIKFREAIVSQFFLNMRSHSREATVTSRRRGEAASIIVNVP